MFPIVVGSGNTKPNAAAGGRTPSAPASSTYADVVASYSPTAYWKLNEASGTVAADSSGNGYNADAVGLTWGSVTGPNGLPAPYFDGVTAYLNAGTVTGALVASDQILTSMWVKVTQAEWEDNADTGLFHVYESATSYHRCYQDDNTLSRSTQRLLSAVGGSAAAAINSLATWTDAWNHVLALTDAANQVVNLWVNGTEIGTAAIGVAGSITPGTVTVAAQAGPTAQMECYVTDAAIWKDTIPGTAMVAALSTAIP